MITTDDEKIKTLEAMIRKQQIIITSLLRRMERMERDHRRINSEMSRMEKRGAK